MSLKVVYLCEERITQVFGFSFKLLYLQHYVSYKTNGDLVINLDQSDSEYMFM